MNGKPDTETPLHENWHLRMLGLKDQPDAHAQNSAILQQLEESSFFLNQQLDSPIQQFTTGDVSPVKKWQSCEQLLRQDVDQFAGQFFELTVPERHKIHARLLTDAEHFPVLKQRLVQLAKGLNLTPELPPGLWRETYRLRDLLLELMTSAPREQAIIRREWQADIEQNRSVWIGAVYQLAKHAPAYTQFSPELTDWIENPPKPKRRHKRISSRSDTGTKSSSSVSGWVIAIAVIILIRILTLFPQMHELPYSAPVPDSKLEFIHELSDERIAELDEQTQRQLGEMWQSQRTPPSKKSELQRLLNELEQDATFQQKLGTLAKLEEDRSLDFGSELFIVTREDGRLVIVFKDFSALVNMFAEEKETSNSQHPTKIVYRPGSPGSHLRDYAIYSAVRDEIPYFQYSKFISVSGVNPPERIFALEGTRTIYLDRQPKLENSRPVQSPRKRSVEGIQKGANARPLGDDDE